MVIIVSLNLFADTHYVSKTDANVSPFTSWANVATNIQDSVDVASEGDIVLVNDAIYNFDRRYYDFFNKSDQNHRFRLHLKAKSTAPLTCRFFEELRVPL